MHICCALYRIIIIDNTFYIKGESGTILVRMTYLSVEKDVTLPFGAAHRPQSMMNYIYGPTFSTQSRFRNCFLLSKCSFY